MLIVEPFVLSDTAPVADRLEVAGTLNSICDTLVPLSVMLTPENPRLEPVIEVAPAVFAPNSVTAFCSAAAPGAATEAVMIPPADVPNVTLLALLKFSVLKVKLPAELDAAITAEAVIVPLFDNPNVMLFELAKLTVPVFCEFAPPEIAAPPPAGTE